MLVSSVQQSESIIHDTPTLFVVVQSPTHVQLIDTHGLQHTRPPVLHSLPEFDQVHVHCIGDAVQPSHPLTHSSPALNPYQHQGLFQKVICSHKMTKIL